MRHIPPTNSKHSRATPIAKPAKDSAKSLKKPTKKVEVRTQSGKEKAALNGTPATPKNDPPVKLAEARLPKTSPSLKGAPQPTDHAPGTLTVDEFSFLRSPKFLASLAKREVLLSEMPAKWREPKSLAERIVKLASIDYESLIGQFQENAPGVFKMVLGELFKAEEIEGGAYATIALYVREHLNGAKLDLTAKDRARIDSLAGDSRSGNVFNFCDRIAEKLRLKVMDALENQFGTLSRYEKSKREELSKAAEKAREKAQPKT